MSLHKDSKPQKAKQQKSIYDPDLQKHIDQPSKQEQKDKRVAIEPSARKLCSPGSSYFYAYPGRKPKLLAHLESYLNKELQSLNAQEPTFQELKLQVYRNVFALFIKEFKTYQPLLSDIKREYETTLAYQQNKIQELEPLQSHLRLVTEECDHKIHARWAQEHSEMAAIKMDKEQLRGELEALKEREKATHAVVEHLQSELSQQYLLYREERDARKLLIRQLNDLTGRSAMGEQTEEENMGRSGSIKASVTRVETQMPPHVHQTDRTEDQEESNWTKTGPSDVVPQCNPATVLQLETLQSEFNQLKSEYDTLLALHQNRSMKKNGHDVKVIQATPFWAQIRGSVMWSKWTLIPAAIVLLNRCKQRVNTQ